MKRNHQILMGIILISLIVWGIDLYVNPIKLNAFPIRKAVLNLTGTIAFVMMGGIMLLAIRPKFLEKYLGGLDKMYHLHKWAGIWSIIFAGLHYAIDLSKPIWVYFFQQGARKGGGKVAPEGLAAFFREYHDIAQDVGEYMVYGLLIMLALTLWNKFSYKIWRYLHKLMAPIFLLIVFHSIILAPFSYWTEPIGVLIALSAIVGSVCAVISMLGLIGYASTYRGTITQIKHYDDLLEIVCKVKGQWSHTAGQYAFIQHNGLEGQHPFTISSADRGDNEIRFSIKALGDYTTYLQEHLNEGDALKVEGPYGLFDCQQSESDHQIWIGGGVGVTPFMAWLERMAMGQTMKGSIDFYYCIRNEAEAVYSNYLQKLCQKVPNVTLKIHCSDEEGYLTANKLPVQVDEAGCASDIWFCGPNGFANQLKKDLKTQHKDHMPNFHQEFFDMR